MHSATYRAILASRGITVGAYSYGVPVFGFAIHPGTQIGRYVSVAAGVSVLNRDHPSDRVSTHPALSEGAPYAETKIGHDVWIGTGATITASCRRVGSGAIIGAGAVVTHDVPEFAVVAGAPARVIRWRFDEPLRLTLLASSWWEYTPQELLAGHGPLPAEWFTERVLSAGEST